MLTAKCSKGWASFEAVLTRVNVLSDGDTWDLRSLLPAVFVPSPAASQPPRLSPHCPLASPADHPAEPLEA